MTFSNSTRQVPTPPADRAPAQPFPTLLSAADAMEHAARSLEDMLKTMDLLDVVRSTFPAAKDAPPLDKDSKEALGRLRLMASGIVDADLQRAAMRGAAQAIRALAQETKLISARALAKGIQP